MKLHHAQIEGIAGLKATGPVLAARATRPRAAKNSAKRRSDQSRGFTLLELLIVGVLTSVLMVAVWSLFRTWGRLYERGEQRVQAAQLMRSLSDQFTDDVRSVAYVSPPPRRQRGSSRSSSQSTRNSSAGGNQALVGGSDWLVLEVLQPPNPFLLASVDEAASDTGEESNALYAPELQRVLYSFQPPLSDGLDSLSPGVAELAELDDTESVDGDEEPLEPFSGLLRMVVPVEQLDVMIASNAGGQSRARSSGLRSSGMRDAVWQLRELAVGVSETGMASGLPLPDSMGMPGEEADGIAGVVGQDEVPEVIWLEFRYFDGSAWTSSWDSRSAGRLPVAVEMRFELKKELPDEDAVSSDGETELVDDGMSESGSLNEYMSSDTDMLGTDPMAADALVESTEATPYFRCLVFLDGFKGVD